MLWGGAARCYHMVSCAGAVRTGESSAHAWSSSSGASHSEVPPTIEPIDPAAASPPPPPAARSSSDGSALCMLARVEPKSAICVTPPPPPRVRSMATAAYINIHTGQATAAAARKIWTLRLYTHLGGVLQH